MGEAMLSFTAQEVLKKAVSLAANEIVLAWGFEQDLISLRESFKMIQAVVADAERQQVTRPPVKLWLKKLKDAGAEVDDVLDEVQYEMLRRKVEIRNHMMKRKVCFFFSSSNCQISFRLKMAHKMKNINTRLDKIMKEADYYQLQPQAADPPHQVVMHEETHSKLDEFTVIGRESEASELVETLIDSSNIEERLTIIPIVGMGGLGKTTLAKSIYNHDRVKSHFAKKAWVCVSVKTDVTTLLVKILESFTKEECKLQTRENVLHRLQEVLGTQKYLLVLDDVWNQERGQWDDFRSCMLKISEGSGNSILITTRKIDVASNATTNTTYTLQGLSDDQCWSIVEDRAFATGGPAKTQELVNIGKKIANKCGGVPLIATVIGSMLCSKHDRAEWLSVQDNGVWDSEEEGDRVEKILKFSFDDLPNPLVKQCFAYCSIFPKDDNMEKEKLIELWMALGFLQADEGKNKEMEDVGEEFFKILLQSSLFLGVWKDDYGNSSHCQMHDLVHDVGLKLSGSESLNLGTSPRNDIPRVRHLALYRGGETLLAVLKEREKARYLHTLILMRDLSENISLKFECLRILNLSECDLRKLSGSVGELKHLRYLDLSDSGIEVLPKSIGKLYNLQTLRLSGCRSLKEFPKEVRNLISLRHLYFHEYSKMPVEVGRLTSLRTLLLFRVGREKGCGIKELGSLKYLRRKLAIFDLEEVSSKEEAQSADLVGKEKLVEVEFWWRRGTGADNREGGSSRKNNEDVLEGLQPHQNLKGLRIDGFSGENFPAWVMNITTGFMSLKRLRVTRCSNIKSIPSLKGLTSLVSLRIRGCVNLMSLPEGLSSLTCLKELTLGPFSEELECFPSLFQGGGGGGIMSNTNILQNSELLLLPSLRELYLFGHTHWEWIPEEVQHFTALTLISISGFGVEALPDWFGNLSSLESIYLENCSKLKYLPSTEAMGRLTKLKTLGIGGCPLLKERCAKGSGSEWSKIQHIPQTLLFEG